MTKISNVMTMLSLLSTGRKYTTEELSIILEVTPRMIRSYKEELEHAGIFIDTIMGPYGGYVLNNPIKFPERRFSKKDIELLEKYLEKNNDQNLKDLKDKIMGVYISSKTRKEALKLNEEETRKYNILTRAMKEKRKVTICYDSLNKGETERVIEPAELFLFQKGWCCAAFCELRKDFRHFELNRIKKIELLDEFF